MLGIRLEPELEEKLESLAKETGRSKSYYAREAIRQYLEDREDPEGYCGAGTARTHHHARRDGAAAWFLQVERRRAEAGGLKSAAAPKNKSRN